MATTCPTIDANLIARDIRIGLPGATQEVVLLELFNATREFCETSLAIRGDSEDIIPAGDNTLRLADTADGLVVIRVLALRGTDGRMIYPQPAARQYAPATSGFPFGFYCPERNLVVFNGTPAEDTPVVALVALSVPVQCTMLPQAAYTQYYEAIKAGTLGRLMMQLGKPYSSMTEGRRQLGRAKALTIQARVTADQENTGADAPWRYPVFGT